MKKKKEIEINIFNFFTTIVIIIWLIAFLSLSQSQSTSDMCIGHCIGTYKYMNYTYETKINKTVQSDQECNNYCEVFYK